MIEYQQELNIDLKDSLLSNQSCRILLQPRYLSPIQPINYPIPLLRHKTISQPPRATRRSPASSSLESRHPSQSFSHDPSNSLEKKKKSNCHPCSRLSTPKTLPPIRYTFRATCSLLEPVEPTRKGWVAIGETGQRATAAGIKWSRPE